MVVQGKKELLVLQAAKVPLVSRDYVVMMVQPVQRVKEVQLDSLEKRVI
jgi:hypothetical protein